jgi:hypothetical protein
MKTLRVLFATALMCFATLAVAGEGPSGPNSPGWSGSGWGNRGWGDDWFGSSAEFDPADTTQEVDAALPEGADYGRGWNRYNDYYGPWGYGPYGGGPHKP